MKMRKPCVWLVLAAMIVMTGMLVGCPKKAEPPPDTTTLPTPAPGPEGDQPEAVEPEIGESEPGDVVLTKELVDQWIACANDEKIQEIADDMEPEETGDDPASLKAAIEGMAASAEFQEAVKAHGFESAEQWVAVTLKVMVGLFNAQLAEDQEQLAEMADAPQIEEAKAEIEEAAAAFTEALGELSEDEQQVIDESLDELRDAME